MFCSNCGAPLGDHDNFCKECGAPAGKQAAPVAPVFQQPAPPPAPVSYQQQVQAVPQPSVQSVTPALAKAKGGPRRACFVIGLITCILLILINIPAFAIGAMAFVAGPLAMMFGASNYEDIFAIGLLACLIGVVLIGMAIISIVFNSISTKITARRPGSKCRSFRIAAAIIVLIDSLITVVPLICLNNMLSDAELFFAFLGIVLIMAIVYLILAIITNSKEKNIKE